MNPLHLLWLLTRSTRLVHCDLFIIYCSQSSSISWRISDPQESLPSLIPCITVITVQISSVPWLPPALGSLTSATMHLNVCRTLLWWPLSSLHYKKTQFGIFHARVQTTVTAFPSLRKRNTNKRPHCKGKLYLTVDFLFLPASIVETDSEIKPGYWNRIKSDGTSHRSFTTITIICKSFTGVLITHLGRERQRQWDI